MSTPPMTAERFWSRVEKTASCWLWPTIGGNGYGHVRLDNLHGAHRIAWFYANGEIPADKLVCHKCDVPNCVNPKHLFLGTHADNMRDMHQKGRGRTQPAGFCRLGHLLDSPNGPGRLCCGTCRKIRIGKRMRQATKQEIRP